MFHSRKTGDPRARALQQGRGAALLTLLTLLFGCQADTDVDTATRTPPPASVTTTTLAPSTWQGQVTSFGSIEALEEVSIAAELSGTVRKVHVDEGDRVSAGQLLLELDPEKSELALKQASRRLEEARAELDDAALKLERRTNLAARDTISKEALDTAQVTLDAATARYQRAVAAHALARRHLADTRIHSPADGVVDIQAVESGEAVQAGVSLITLQVSGGLRMQTWVSEADILMLSPGNSASITASVLPGQTFPAIIEWLGAAADKSTGNYPVKLLLDNPGEILRPGMTATAAMQTREINGVLILPEQTLVDRERRKVVFVVEDGVAHMREPILATGISNHLRVLAGLSPYDELIVTGHEFVIDGAVVTVTEER